MRTPDDVAKLARTRYDHNWRDWLQDAPTAPVGSFPLAPPTAEEIATRTDDVSRWKLTWKTWAQIHRGELREAPRRTVIGTQTVYTHIDLATVADLAAFDPARAKQWSQATDRWQRLRTLPRVSHQQLRPYLQKIVIDLPDLDFQILLRAADWFTNNPRSGYTIRQVDVEGMHTKWLAVHRSLVLACLGEPDDVPSRADGEVVAEKDLAQADLDALGLRALPPHADVILADPTDRAKVGGLRYLRAPVPELATLPVLPRMVVIVENKESAYLIPDRPGLMVLHSLGNHLNVLSDLPWVAGARCFYWGDLDRAGLTLLSRAREKLPTVISVLMDDATFQKYSRLAVRDTTKADPPAATLLEPESAAYKLVGESDGYLRLEQERLPALYALDALDRAMELASAGT